MTSTVIAAIVLTLIAGVLFALRRPHRGRSFDLGAVSTGWLADLRRDEPWSSNL